MYEDYEEPSGRGFDRTSTLMSDMARYHSSRSHRHPYLRPDEDTPPPPPPPPASAGPHVEECDNEHLGSYVVHTSSGSVYIPSDMNCDTVARHKYNSATQLYRAGYIVDKDDRYATPFGTLATRLTAGATSGGRAVSDYADTVTTSSGSAATKYSTGPQGHYHTPTVVSVAAEKTTGNWMWVTTARACSWKSATAVATTVALLLLVIVIYLLTALAGENHHSCSPSGVFTPARWPSSASSAGEGRVAVGDSSGAETSAPSSVSGHGAATADLAAGSVPPSGSVYRSVRLSRLYSRTLAAHGFWPLQLQLVSGGQLRWNVSAASAASLAVYARRNALPTHTQHDVRQVVRSHTSVDGVDMRHPVNRFSETFVTAVDAGHWFINIYNDADRQTFVSLSMKMTNSELDELTDQPPVVNTGSDCSTGEVAGGCGPHGDCVLGRCRCRPGFTGQRCSQPICPALCSGRGVFVAGVCHCTAPWTGHHCEARTDDKSSCLGHNCPHCVSTQDDPQCQHGSCDHVECGEREVCVQGVCVCREGWRGADCSHRQQQPSYDIPPSVGQQSRTLQVAPEITLAAPSQCITWLENACSSQGRYDATQRRCLCDAGWTGQRCSSVECTAECGEHGRCVNNSCLCDIGWSGEHCDVKDCDPRCRRHGSCVDGVCSCSRGWNGKHCSLHGCPNNCSGHGICELSYMDEWECVCDDNNWTGKDCSIAQETNCNDLADNDHDGLTDCEDAECCLSAACETSQLCVTVPDPVDILLRRHPPAASASFFERCQFLIEEGSVQRYTVHGAFNRSQLFRAFNSSRAAVVRGRVVSSPQSGSVGVPGVRVSVDLGGTSSDGEGFTLTRSDGWFDLLVNGGGVLRLWFRRSPFQPLARRVFVAWNQIEVMDDVILDQQVPTSAGVDTTTNAACLAHNYDIINPVVLASWKHEYHDGCHGLDGRMTTVAESQVTCHSVAIDGSPFHLVYQSSRARGYRSTIRMRLTPAEVPATLKHVHVHVQLQGERVKHLLEAEANLQFTYAWDRFNVYRQRVYGMATARVSIGYEYSNCDHIVWMTKTTDIAASDVTISSIGGWNIDVHHSYNLGNGIVYLGDGGRLLVAERRQLIEPLMGDGHQRPLLCSFGSCQGNAGDQQLLSVSALAAAADGSIFVGDFNVIRRLAVDGTVTTLASLNASEVSYRYHLAYSSVDDALYYTSAETYRILRIEHVSTANTDGEQERPLVVVVGSGERCPPGDTFGCGDGGLALEARLTYPKGMAIASDGGVYFADGTAIRVVDVYGVIDSVISSGAVHQHWRPFPCQGSVAVDAVQLRWPTSVAISPADNTVHFIDDHMVFQITADGKVRRIAGQLTHCRSVPTADTRWRHSALVEPQAVAFSADGRLFIAESDSRRVNRVRAVVEDGRLENVAGTEPPCDCRQVNCICYDKKPVLAGQALFASISAVTVTADGSLLIADQASHQLRRLARHLPGADQNGLYRVPSADGGDIYVFNSHGKHIRTERAMGGAAIYTFHYNLAGDAGRLSAVVDKLGGKLTILRDYTYQVTSLENFLGSKMHVSVSPSSGCMQSVVTADGHNASFQYLGNTGLMISRHDSFGRAVYYEYDLYGRVTGHVTASGSYRQLAYELTSSGARVTLKQDGTHHGAYLISGHTSSVTRITEAGRWTTTVAPGGEMEYYTPWGQTTTVSMTPSQLDISSVGRQKTVLGGDVVNTIDWQPRTLAGNSDKKSTALRTLYVNGRAVLMLHYDALTAVLHASLPGSNVTVLDVRHNPAGKAVEWRTPAHVADTEVSYDEFGRVYQWQCGSRSIVYTYDMAGRLSEVVQPSIYRVQYGYNTSYSTQPTSVLLPGGGRYVLNVAEGRGDVVESATLPNGGRHRWQLQTHLDGVWLMYWSPVARRPFMIKYTDSLQVIEQRLPDGRSVLHRYDSAGRPEISASTTAAVRFRYHTSTSLLTSWQFVDGEHQASVTVKHHASLLKRLEAKYANAEWLSDYRLKYMYDNTARLRKISMKIGGEHVAPILMRRSPVDGRFLQLNDLMTPSPQSGNGSLVRSVDGVFSRSVFNNVHGQLRQMLITLAGRIRAKLDVRRDAAGRVVADELDVADYGRRLRLFNYSADGHLAAVEEHRRIRGMSSSVVVDRWRFEYDTAGAAKGSVFNNVPTQIRHDGGSERLLRHGDVAVSHDVNGCVSGVGRRRYFYDAAARLTAVELDVTAGGGRRKRTVTLVQFGYDALGRLSWRRQVVSSGVNVSATISGVVQFIYADPSRKHRLTHVHYPRSGRTDVYLYDEAATTVDDRLLAVETGAQRVYVATDASATPVAVFAGDGRLVELPLRDPWGHKRQLDDDVEGEAVDGGSADGWPRLMIGAFGWLLEPQLQLLFSPEDGRVYCSQLRQFLTPGWQTAMTRVARDPRALHLYRLMNNDPVNVPSSVDSLHLSGISVFNARHPDTASWLSELGFSITAMQWPAMNTGRKEGSCDYAISNDLFEALPHTLLIPRHRPPSRFSNFRNQVVSGAVLPRWRGYGPLMTGHNSGCNRWRLIRRLGSRQLALPFSAGLMVHRIDTMDTLRAQPTSTADESVDHGDRRQLQSILGQVFNNSRLLLPPLIDWRRTPVFYLLRPTTAAQSDQRRLRTLVSVGDRRNSTFLRDERMLLPASITHRAVQLIQRRVELASGRLSLIYWDDQDSRDRGHGNSKAIMYQKRIDDIRRQVLRQLRRENAGRRGGSSTAPTGPTMMDSRQTQRVRDALSNMVTDWYSWQAAFQLAEIPAS